MPQPEAHPAEIEELYAAAEESGVEVLDADNNPTLIAEAGVDEDEVVAVGAGLSLEAVRDLRRDRAPPQAAPAG